MEVASARVHSDDDFAIVAFNSTYLIQLWLWILDLDFISSFSLVGIWIASLNWTHRNKQRVVPN